MIYVYDIVVNFTDNFYYDFYEWDNKDNLINIKKIPLFRVSTNTIYDFINYKIKVNRELLSLIENKTIMFKKNRDKYIYSAVFSDTEKSIVLSFDNKGNVLYKSSMLLDEEEDTNTIVVNQKEVIIKYKRYSINNKKILRSDINNRNIIVKELKRIYENKEYDKLKYIYYELFEETLNDNKKIFNYLLKRVDEYINDYCKVLDYLKIK